MIEFTDSAKINVQTGTTSLTGAATLTTINLGTAVTTSRTFVLVGVRSSPPGGDISSSMVRARLISTTQITIDRQTANYNATEIVWQTIELKDGSKVQGGTFAITSSTQLTITRTSTAGSADLAWFVVEWGRATGTSNPKVGRGRRWASAVLAR